MAQARRQEKATRQPQHGARIRQGKARRAQIRDNAITSPLPPMGAKRPQRSATYGARRRCLSLKNVLGPAPGVGVMAKRSQGWVKCEDRLPYYRDSSWSLPLATTTTPRPRPRLHDSLARRTSAPGRRGRPGSRARPSARAGLLRLQCSARVLFRKALRSK
jgi:hypothetical protein